MTIIMLDDCIEAIVKCSFRDFEVSVKVTEYHEKTWFKNNLDKVLSAYYLYAGIMTTINSMSFRSLWSKLALQESV